MIKILMGLFALLLGIVSWFFFNKASEAFSVLLQNKPKHRLNGFCRLNGWVYLVFALFSVSGIVWDTMPFIAIILVVVSVYTASVAWRLAAFLKN
ncbi:MULTISPECIES: hypothetical protein [unclassified Jeotgalibaca]|uniref:hypothetical protein n=1 Tax=unclassified Jeotgalibaca TaxID=2621505 RepID=UPI003FCFF954